VIEGITFISIDEDGKGKFGSPPLVELRGVSTDLNGLLANASIIGIENLVATPVVGTSAGESLAAGASSTLLQGLGGNDTLTGSKDSDTLDGGTGSDSLVGGNGNDTYIVDSAKDVIADIGGTDDRIQASISIDLNAAAYFAIDHVTLTGTAALNATGNDNDNFLIGNAGANILDGHKGEDLLAGGAGNDTYVVDNIDDLIFENPGEGTDQVNASVSHTLAANVENLTLTGTDDFFGEGNALANKITGNSGDNLLLGDDGNDTLTGNEGSDTLDGGHGTDSMTGGTGDDTYFVDSATDKVAESSASGGTDEVVTSISYTLGSNLENLTVVDVATFGVDTIDGTGNTLNNVITARSGNNVLSGLAGNDTLDGGLGNDLLLGGDGADQLQANAGADTMEGGAGSDRFAFNSASLDGVDVITDFTSAPGGDVLDVSDLLTGFNPATSNVNDFLQASENNGSTTIKVDANGGGNSFVDMVVLDGVNTDIMGLLNNGSLVLAN
jgi:Ca2+-binding RTX toxin-like protein